MCAGNEIVGLDHASVNSTAPWTAADFSATTSPMSFVLATVAAVWSMKIVRDQLRGRRDLIRAVISDIDHNHEPAAV